MLNDLASTQTRHEDVPRFACDEGHHDTPVAAWPRLAGPVTAPTRMVGRG